MILLKLVLGLVLLSPPAPAHQGEPVPDVCELALGGHVNPPFEIRVSERVASEAEKYRVYVDHLTKKGGLLEKLGIRMTGQIIEFLPGRDLNAASSGTSGGYPVPHYLDGASVLRSLQPSGGYALEVVYPGPLFQHGFYRDDNPEPQQKSIIDHVVGHNVFALFSGLGHYRAGQGMVASQELAEVLETAYQHYDKDEVQRFYLWALTINSLADFSTPLFQTPAEFEPKLRVLDADPRLRRPTTIRRHPAQPTENVREAFAANIAPHQPPYQRRILELLGISSGFQPALIHTQVMNEGFASIMQEILAANSDINLYPEFLIDSTKVMQSESKPNLRDPYSLGVFCWRNLRTKFHDRPGVKGRPLVERDNKFLHYAVNEVIGHMVDDEFLRMALEQSLIDKYNLAVVRKATPQEQDPNLPKPPSKDPIAQYTIVTRDQARVVASINDMVLRPKYVFRPRVKLTDFNRPTTGEVEFKINDQFGDQWPLRKQSLGPALFASAKVIDRPVSIECLLLDFGQHGNTPNFEADADDDDPYSMWRPRYRKPIPPRTIRARVVVSPYGDVKVFRLEPPTAPAKAPLYPGLGAAPVPAETFDPGLTQEIEEPFRAYLADLYIDSPEAERELLRHSPALRQQMTASLNGQVNEADFDGVVSHAPGAVGAILEYQRVTQRRLFMAMDRALKGGKGIVTTATGQIRVKALPSVVRFEFDRDYLQYWEGQQEPDKVYKLNRTFAWQSEPDDGQPFFGAAFGPVDRIASAVAPVNGQPGDKVWGPDSPPGGSPGVKPGEDPNDLSWVDVPNDLYAKFLGENVRLPNLNKKPGDSNVIRRAKGKRRNQMWGEAMYYEISENALKRGMEQAYQDGRDPLLDIQDTLEEGMGLLQPRDWVVRSTKPKPHRETKAVLTFIRDASASTAKYDDAFKRFVNDMEILIAARYKGFAYQYITFDTRAHLHKTKQQFLRAKLGGGTLHPVAIRRAHDNYRDNFPRQTYDRFTFLLGDLEDAAEPSLSLIRELLDDSEYFGTVAGLNMFNGQSFSQMLAPLQALARSTDNMGMTILNEDGTYTVRHLRELLKNDPEKMN